MNGEYADLDDWLRAQPDGCALAREIAASLQVQVDADVVFGCRDDAYHLRLHRVIDRALAICEARMSKGTEAA
jgi:hypothetical protein